jgi:transglutaminase-like putative cysteine protease
MKEPEQHFSSKSIDQQTEGVFSELPTQDSGLIADLYQTYTLSREEHSRSLQRIWSRLAQAQEHYLPLQEGQQWTGSTPLSKGRKDVNANRPDAPVPGSFQRAPQPLPRGLRRSLWSKLSAGVAVAVVLIIILSWVLLTHAFPMQEHRTTSGASLTLGGGPQLNNTIVFLVHNSEGVQYLATISFDTYDGHTWSNTAVSRSPLPANKRLSSEGSPVHLVTQRITLVNPAGEQQPYIVGAGQIASVDLPTTALINKTTGSLIAVLLNNGQPLAAGERYTVQSYVSLADITELRAIPFPADAPQLPQNYHGPLPSTYYNPAILRASLRLPKIDPRVKELAQQLTAGAQTMYDKVVALENYFRTSFTYSTTIHPPPGAEATAWLLFQSNHSAFCNYFASAMAVMARELGMPARVVIGYTAGAFDAKTHDWVVHGSDAHAWTQIYFAGYGWINFEPSPSFSQFPRPL